MSQLLSDLQHRLLLGERGLQQLHGAHALGVVALQQLVVVGLGAQLLQHQRGLLFHLLHLVFQQVNLEVDVD